jgi:hypothetical protein
MENSTESFKNSVSSETPTNLLEFAQTPSEQTLARYFEMLNAGEFQQAADLFAADGKLYPPFEEEVVGREAIVQYLEKEAQGLQLFPLTKSVEQAEEGALSYHIIGKVKTSLFSVNVGWNFIVNSDAEICSVRVKLLAALQELLRLKK